MQDLKKLEKIELVDLLAKETARYYKMSKTGGEHKEYNECKRAINEIQSEISNRTKQKNKS